MVEDESTSGSTSVSSSVVVQDFEDVVRQSWQSFSTMKRFVKEAGRLENASWRLWHMQQQKDLPDSASNMVTSGSSSGEYSHSPPQLKCIYCELIDASVSCNGCCHDPYCSPCFQLLHKKGHLATHTAFPLVEDPMSLGVSSSTSQQSLTGLHHEEDQHSSSSSCGSTLEESQANDDLLKIKKWEIQMDQVLKGLMQHSIHYTHGDISIQNINDMPSLSPSSSVSENLDQQQPPFESKPAMKRSNRKGVSCAHCRGNHMTFSCPELEASFAEDQEKTRENDPVIDFNVGLRKCFTSLHNDNQSNSTHAYLGDEISVHHGKHHVFSSQACSRSFVSAGKSYLGDESSQHRGAHFSPNLFTAGGSSSSTSTVSNTTSISSSSSGLKTCYEQAEELAEQEQQYQPLLLPLQLNTPRDNDDNKEYGARVAQHDGQWVLASVIAALPLDTFSQLSGFGKNIKTLNVLARGPSVTKWTRRTFTLSRNWMCEYLEQEKEGLLVHHHQQRPIGCAILTEGKVERISGKNILQLSYCMTAIPEHGHMSCELSFTCEKECHEWKRLLEWAIHLSLDDLYDCDNMEETVEASILGRGRFSIVRRAQVRQQLLEETEKEAWTTTRLQSRALKIIDKKAFWSLVKNETERNDTIFREVLTQTLLTARGSSCPPIVQIHAVFETPEVLVLELDLMDGGDLFDILAQVGALTEEHVATLMAELIYSIYFLRQNGVAHRDIKLSNLALTSPFDARTAAKEPKQRSLKLADFGMAELIRPDDTLLGRCGTPGYVSPEILKARTQEPYASNVDMFSAGVVCFTLLCGYEPFYGVTDKALIQANKVGAFQFHDPEWTYVSPHAKDLICQMMHLDPQVRISPAQALVHPFLIHAARTLDLIDTQDKILDCTTNV